MLIWSTRIFLIQFARAHQNWTTEVWKNIVWSEWGNAAYTSWNKVSNVYVSCQLKKQNNKTAYSFWVFLSTSSLLSLYMNVLWVFLAAQPYSEGYGFVSSGIHLAFITHPVLLDVHTVTTLYVHIDCDRLAVNKPIMQCSIQDFENGMNCIQNRASLWVHAQIFHHIQLSF